MKKKKRFDCVEMQHRGGERINSILKDMTLEQQIAYWQERTEALLVQQQALREQREAPAEKATT